MNNFTTDFISFVSTTQDRIENFDYQELINNLIVLGAIVAVTISLVYQQLRKVRFSTPHQFIDTFYFGLNLTHSGDDDERFGIAVKDYYIGLYGKQLCWGQLDEQGCLS